MTSPYIWIGGWHAVRAALARPTQPVQEILVDAARRDQRYAAIQRAAHTAGVPLRQVTTAVLEARAPGIRHQGIVACCTGAREWSEDELFALIAQAETPVLLLVLDGIQDPHNLGACLRTAEAAGVTAVIVPRDRAATITPTVIKVASGAVDAVPFVTVTNLARTLRELKERGVWLVGMAGEAGDSLYTVDLRGSSALILGAEGSGARRLTKTVCDYLVHIPLAGVVESLNVSVAAGVCLFEAVRQRASAK